MKTLIILFSFFISTGYAQSDSIKYKNKYDLGLLSKSDYEFLLKAKAEQIKLKEGSMDKKIHNLKRQLFIDELQNIINGSPKKIQAYEIIETPNKILCPGLLFN